MWAKSITGHSISQWLPCPVPSWVSNTIGTWGGNSVKFSQLNTFDIIIHMSGTRHLKRMGSVCSPKQRKCITLYSQVYDYNTLQCTHVDCVLHVDLVVNNMVISTDLLLSINRILVATHH